LENPTAMSPSAEHIGAEPAPQSRSANLSDQPLGDHFAPDLGIWERESKQLNRNQDRDDRS